MKQFFKKLWVQPKTICLIKWKIRKQQCVSRGPSLTHSSSVEEAKGVDDTSDSSGLCILFKRIQYLHSRAELSSVWWRRTAPPSRSLIGRQASVCEVPTWPRSSLPPGGTPSPSAAVSSPELSWPWSPRPSARISGTAPCVSAGLRRDPSQTPGSKLEAGWKGQRWETWVTQVAHETCLTDKRLDLTRKDLAF